MIPDQWVQSLLSKSGSWIPCGILKVADKALAMHPAGTVPPEPDASVPSATTPVPVEGSETIVPPGIVEPGAAGVVEEAICGMVYLLLRSSQQQCFIMCKPKGWFTTHVCNSVWPEHSTSCLHVACKFIRVAKCSQYLSTVTVKYKKAVA